MSSRTGEKIIRLLVENILLNMDITEKEKLARVDTLKQLICEDILNTGQVSASDIVLEIENNRLKKFSISARRLKETLLHYQSILDIIYLTDTERNQNTNLYPSYAKMQEFFRQYFEVMNFLNQPLNTVLSEDQIYSFQDKADAFGKTFSSCFSKNEVTNYFHLLFSG